MDQIESVVQEIAEGDQKFASMKASDAAAAANLQSEADVLLLPKKFMQYAKLKREV